MSKKALLIEYHNHHDEVLPSYAYCLMRLGFDVDILTTSSNIENNAFYYIKNSNLKYRVLKPIDKGLIKYGLIDVVALPRKYDVVIINTVEPTVLLQRFLRLNKSFIGTVHNAILLDIDPVFIKGIKSGKFTPIVLADFIAINYLNDINKVIYPYYLGDVPKSKNNILTFCVQGIFDINRRNYLSLIKALISAKKDHIDDFIIKVIGTVRKADLKLFRDIVKDEGIEHYFSYEEGGHTYCDYYGSIASSDFILPLIDKNASSSLPYYKYSTSSSIITGIGIGIPLVVEKDLSDLYNIYPFSITYGNDSLYKAMRLAIDTSEKERTNLRDSIEKYRMQCLEKSVENLGMAINKL